MGEQEFLARTRMKYEYMYWYKCTVNSYRYYRVAEKEGMDPGRAWDASHE